MDKLKQIIGVAVKAGFDIEIEPEISYAEEKYGDYATNVSFKLAAKVGQSPMNIAEKLTKQLQNIDEYGIERVTATAGFINITMKPEFWGIKLGKIGDFFEFIDEGKGVKAQVEFVSANPTGPLTLGNARGGFVGDVIANVLSATGYAVTREYYFNDAGTQIGKLVESISSAAGISDVEQAQYKGEYIDELSKDLPNDLKIHVTDAIKINESVSVNKANETIGIWATQTIFEKHIRPSIEKMGIKFDVYFNERDLVGPQFEAAIERLKKAGLYLEDDGATWVRTSALGDERDRPIIKSNGDTTYLGNDIAYHLNIFERRGFDIAVKVWGADHAGQVPSLKLTMKKLCPDKKLDFVIMQFVRLIKNGKEVKMSKRAGTYVTTDELIDEVGADVARFFFLMRSSDSHMDFDLTLAKETSQKNPYWYVMYSYARANSILREANNSDLELASRMMEPNSLERQIIKQMAMLPELVREIATDYGVHRLTFFGIELAKLFHDYYESERIIKLSKEQAGSKLYLIQQYVVFMKVYFRLLGISAIEKM